MNGFELIRQMMGDYDNPLVEFRGFKSAAAATEEIRKQDLYKYETYGNLLNTSSSKNMEPINAAQAGTSYDAQKIAMADREKSRTLGKVSRDVTSGQLQLEKIRDENNNRNNYTFINKAGGTLRIRLGGDITEVAMNAIAEAVRNYFDNQGDLVNTFKDIIIDK